MLTRPPNSSRAVQSWMFVFLALWLFLDAIEMEIQNMLKDKRSPLNLNYSILPLPRCLCLLFGWRWNSPNFKVFCRPEVFGLYLALSISSYLSDSLSLVWERITMLPPSFDAEFRVMLNHWILISSEPLSTCLPFPSNSSWQTENGTSFRFLFINSFLSATLSWMPDFQSAWIIDVLLTDFLHLQSQQGALSCFSD